MRTLPPDRRVDCACARPLPREVLNRRVVACMRCGHVTAVEAQIEEPRPHDVRHVGYEVIDLDPALLAWMAAWPRNAFDDGDRRRFVFLPAALRSDDPRALDEAGEAAWEAQRELPFVERLRGAGPPCDPPPGRLPAALAVFGQARRALALSPANGPDTLLAAMARKDLGATFALDLLGRRGDAPAALVAAIGGPQADTAWEAVSRLRLTTPPIVEALRARISAASRADAREVRAVVQIVGAFGEAGQLFANEVRALADRIDPGADYYLHQSVVTLADRIQKTARR